MRKGNFIQEQDILDQWDVWRKSARKLENRTVPDKLVEQMYVIASHLLEHPRFMRYPLHEKEEMKQDGVVKCVKNLKNYDPLKGNIFSYFTRCCWTAYVDHLAKYYKDMNNKRELLLRELNNLDESQLAGTKYLNELLADIRKTVAEYNGGGENDYD